MKMYCISDNTDTYTGMKLAGVDGVVVHSAPEVASALEKAAADPEIGIVMITELLAREADEAVSMYKAGGAGIIVIEIPDRHGFGLGKTRMTDFIRTSIGLKLDDGPMESEKERKPD